MSAPSRKEPPGRRQRNPPGGVWSKVADAIVDLLKVRSIVTIIVISVMSVMAIREAIDPGAFLAVAGSIIAYYFTRKDRPP